MYYTRRSVILAKIETQYKTDPSPAPAVTDAIEIESMTFSPIEGEDLKRNLYRPHFGAEQSVPGIKRGVLEIEIGLSGSGTAGTAPAWGKLIRACGYSETVTAATKVEYDPVTTAHESITFYVHMDGNLHKLHGARGTFTLDLNERAMPVLKFTFDAILGTIATAAVAAGDFSGWVRPVVTSFVNTTSFALHGHAAAVKSLSFDAGNQVRHINRIAHEEIVIAEREVTGSCSIETPVLATKNYFSLNQNGAIGAFTVTHGVTAGNTIVISAPAVQISSVKYGDDEGTQMLDLGLHFTPSAGNDEIKITVQ
jgi:hypothetical protein